MTDPVVWALVIVAAALLLGAVLIYNGLVSKRQLTQNGWADIDVQLKRRADLIPSLVDTVKAYAAHEKSLFAEITTQRTEAAHAGGDPASRAKAETALSKPIARLLALAEAYPDLKANQNFLDLQSELSETENRIEMARRFYNGAVRELNTAVESFPANLVAGAFGFGKRAYFEIETAASLVPDIRLSPDS